ncbi:MAG: ComEC/Rec2 family competence protein [Patescibacteria group bacterium]
MAHKKIIYLSLFLLAFLNLVLSGMIFWSQNQELRVAFLDVGQGDAILISKGMHQILIDGGPSREAILEGLGRSIPFWDQHIEVVIATHPDADHLSGLVDVLEKYHVSLVLDSGMESDTQVFRKFEEVIREKNIRRESARNGDKMKIQSAVLEILSPFADFPGGKIKDTNLNSLVSRLTFGKNSFLLMADAPMEKEQELLEKYPNLETQFLKVGHHGSKYSSGEEFLEKVNPKEVILSVGKNNRYGHPAPEVLERLRNIQANIFRTDEIGSLSYACPREELSCQRENF